MASSSTVRGSRRQRLLFALTGVIALCMAVAAQPLKAGTLCVSPQGNAGCYASIETAVSHALPGDTIRVAPGTYQEYVTVSTPVSLVGAGANITIIDATNQPNAVYVNGTSGVVVTGFTLENAEFEGIQIHHSSNVTVWGNRVVSNNQNLDPSTPACPDLTTIYPYETSEAEDCGEGIHLVSTDHSSVYGNTIEGNAGGVLLTDEDGPTHDNSIRGNTVLNNVYDCGITLASHSPAGVYDNTIAENDVEGNGTNPPGGAGVGLFSPGGPKKNYGNVVVNNDLVGNGLAGVALHTHAPGTEVLKDELVIGNRISRNGPDTDVNPDGGPNGISLLVVGGTVSGLVFSQNTFNGEAVDIAVNVVPGTVSVTAQLNRFEANAVGVKNLANGTINATENWWGCPQGPGAHGGCSTFNGNGVMSAPWLQTPLPNLGRE